jgi:hypothetical protein
MGQPPQTTEQLSVKDLSCLQQPKLYAAASWTCGPWVSQDGLFVNLREEIIEAGLVTVQPAQQEGVAMSFGPLELEACGENNFTMKALGLLACRQDVPRRFVAHLCGELMPAPTGAITIVFFTRIGEGFFREAIERALAVPMTNSIWKTISILSWRCRTASVGRVPQREG